MATKNLSAIVTFANTPSYSKTIWQGGDLITDIRLNNMEQGIENASSTVNATQANTTKAYVLGRDASSGAGMDEAVYDSGVYLGESAGTLHVDTTSFPAICATRSNGNAGNISIETIAGARDIWLGVGSGGSNRGIYDQENSKWLVYFDSNNEGHLNGGSTSADSLNVSDAGSAQTPVYFKDGVPVACSFSGGSSGSSGNGNVYYGTCSTAAGTAEKVVTLSGSDSFSLETGAHLTVDFTHYNSADNPTLNVNSTGANSILGNTETGGNYVTSNTKSWWAHSMVEFVFNGTSWIIVSIGYKGRAMGLYSDAVCYSGAYGDYSHSEGYSTASGDYSHSEGYSIASGECSHSEGGWINSYPEAKGFASHVEGADTIAEGDYAHAEGGKNTASGTASHAEGYDTTAGVVDSDGNVSGNYSHAEGICGTASGTASHVEGGYDSSLASPVYNEASGGASHAEGCGTTASGNYGSHAEGAGGTASGSSAHVEGGYYYSAENGGCNVANGYASHSEGADTKCYSYAGHAEGYGTIAGDKESKVSIYSAHAEGYDTEASGNQSHAEGYGTTANSYETHAEGLGTIANNLGMHAGGKYNKQSSSTTSTPSTTTGDAFVIGNGTSNIVQSNAFRVTFAGDVYGLSAFNSSGADYAEFVKPWADGNPDNEDRVGYFVTVKDGALYKAEPGEFIAGVISGSPSVVGNSDEDYYWRYERDEFNRVVWEDAPVVEEKRDENGNPVFDENRKPVFEETGEVVPNGRMKISADYDSSLQADYIERKNRPEWDYVGIVGVLAVRDDGTCEVGQFCKCGEGGIATLAEERGFDTYMVIERKTDNVVSVILK